MVVLEAMASGVPVLYPSYAGVSEVVDAGIKIDPYRPEDVASALLALLDNEVEWSRVVAEQTRALSSYERRVGIDPLLTALGRCE